MRKLLALVLALVMTLGLATVGANAALSDYKDGDTIKNREAAAVMQAIGVMVGDTQGNFNATETLKRSEAAKILTYLMLGNKAADALRGSGTRFTDVSADAWYCAYVEYCSANGIIAGMGDGKFQPDGQLTATAFAKMLIVALGYDPRVEGLEGSDWSINTQKIANQIGLFDGNPNVVGSAAVTRDEAALYAFNTICTPLVQYDSTVNVNVNGANVIVGNNNAKFVTSVDNTGRYTNIDDLKDNANRQANIVEFAEEYYQKLRRENDDLDDFGRPAHVWTYDKKDVGTFLNSSLLIQSYTDAVSGKELYNLIGKSALEDFDVTVYEDGIDVTSADILSDIAKKNDGDWFDTDTGVLTEVYVDNDYEEVTIVLIHTYLAIADSDYNTKSETLSLKAYGVQHANGEYSFKKSATTTVKAEKDDFAIVEGAKEDDAFLVTFANDELQSIAKAKVSEDATVTGFNEGKKSVTVDGTKYDKAVTAVYDSEVLDVFTGKSGAQNMKDTTYDIYFDAYGNVIGVSEYDSVKNYAFVTGIDDGGTNYLAKVNNKATLIFLDGTIKTVEIDAKDSKMADGSRMAAGYTVNTWVTYTVGKNNVYSLTQIAGAIDADNNVKEAQSTTPATEVIDIDSKHVSLAGGTTTYKKVYGNNDTVYLTAELDTLTDSDNKEVIVISGVDSVATGISNVSITTYTSAEQINSADAAAGATTLGSVVYTLYKDNGYVIAAVVIGDDGSSSDNIIYVKKAVNYESYDAKEDEWTWSLDAYLNGEQNTIKEKGDKLDNLKDMSKNEWWEVSYNSDGYVVKAKLISEKYPSSAYPTNDVVYMDSSTFTAGGKTYTIGDVIGNDDVDTIIYQEERTELPEMKGQTLYLDSDMNDGFRVSSDVKIVLYQYNNNKDKWTTYQGYKELENVFDSLNQDADGAYDFVLSAKIDDGVAKTVIINDRGNDYSGRTVNNTNTAGKYVVTYDDFNKLSVEYTSTDGNESVTVARDAIISKLLKDGYKNITVSVIGTNYEFAADYTNTYGGTTSLTFVWENAKITIPS